MPSSTSSSSRRVPALRWLPLFAVALGLPLVCIAGMETDLAARGFRPTVPDGEARWLAERQRAVALGKDALILVGDSRMQLDLDQDVLSSDTRLRPVQLALNGTPFLRVFRGLAADPGITGTLLVNFSPLAFSHPDEIRRIARYELDAEKAPRVVRWPNFSTTEAWLTEVVHGRLRSYADGGSPWVALRRRVLSPRARPQYLMELPDRSELADYSRTQMPEFYYERTSIDLGDGGRLPEGDDAHIRAYLQQRIAGVRPADDSLLRQQLPEVASMAAAVAARGGRVIFVQLPESGYVKEIDARRYPRGSFWDPFAADVGTQALDFEDVATLRGFSCPDGSHLDMRDRATFTHALLEALHLGAAP